MGSETSRLSRLAKFTRIQKFSGDSPPTVNHIKTASFQGLIPGDEQRKADDQRSATEVQSAALLPQESPIPGEAVATVIRDASEAASEGPRSEAPRSEAPRSEADQGVGPDADHSGPPSVFKSEEVVQDISERSGPPPRLSQGGSRVIEDGETKLMRGGSQSNRTSGSCGSGGVGGSESAKASFRRNRTHSLRTDRNSRPGEKLEIKSSSKDGGALGSGPAVGTPFPKRPLGCKLSVKTWSKLEELFRLMDEDGSNAVTREEARVFFKGAFSNLSADAMFNEVDVDGSGAITSEEFVKFWQQVRSSGYKEQDILDEVSELIEGGTWVDWKDGRDTVAHHDVKFPSRPMLCRLSTPAWKKCEELFYMISGSQKEMSITREKAQTFFKGAFALISADAMFNEIDVKHHGIITAKDFMNFWVQVKYAGYKDKDIIEEINELMEGSPWVDWKDGRRT